MAPHSTFTFHFHELEEEMATHSSVLAWRIPGTAGPGGLPSMGSHRVGHDWSDLAAAAAAYFLSLCFRLISISVPCILPWYYCVKVVYVSKFWALLSGTMEKAMAPHSSTLAWKIPWTEEPGGPLSMGSHRVGHDWSDLAAAAAEWN